MEGGTEGLLQDLTGLVTKTTEYKFTQHDHTPKYFLPSLISLTTSFCCGILEQCSRWPFANNAQFGVYN